MEKKIMIKIFFNKNTRKQTEKRIIFKLKTGYYLELLNPGTMQLLESNRCKTTKYGNSQNVAHSETN